MLVAFLLKKSLLSFYFGNGVEKKETLKMLNNIED